jgi:hypothetical protein
VVVVVVVVVVAAAVVVCVRACVRAVLGQRLRASLAPPSTRRSVSLLLSLSLCPSLTLCVWLSLRLLYAGRYQKCPHQVSALGEVEVGGKKGDSLNGTATSRDSGESISHSGLSLVGDSPGSTYASVSSTHDAPLLHSRAGRTLSLAPSIPPPKLRFAPLHARPAAGQAVKRTCWKDLAGPSSSHGRRRHVWN